ncbi:MAG: ABC transporter permease [Actinomycetaceae bacterium]|nr:ABC transporter permease [Actinomycetaceae bacterium]
MIRQLRMSAFHVRQFASVPYFVQLMLITTVTSTLVQLLAVQAWGGSARIAWMRAAVIGMWTVATASAGIIGFERYKGTLVHLVLARIHPLRALLAVVAAASTFGLAAFPVAWATWALASSSLGFTGLFSPGDAAAFVAHALLVWLGCLAASCVVASLFVLTPNAIAYEELLLVPVFLASGILFTSTAAPPWLEAAGWAIPLRGPVALLMGTSGLAAWQAWAASIACIAAWFGAAWLLGRGALRQARVTGTLEVI